jgi:hypothetical protein
LTQRSAERLAKGNAKFFNLAVGDRVLFKDNFRTSNIFAKADWTPVRVTEIFPSSDGAVRTVTVQKENGEERTLTTDKLAIVDEDLLERYKKCQGLQTVDRSDDIKNDGSRGVGVVEATEADQAGPSTAPAAANQAGSLTVTPRKRETTTAGHGDLLETPNDSGEENPSTAGREGLRASLHCDNDEENPTTAGREGLRASLQCDTSGDRAPSAHATPSASNVRASTEETTSSGRRRGRPRGAKNRSWQRDPTRYGLRSSTTADNNDV